MTAESQRTEYANMRDDGTVVCAFDHWQGAVEQADTLARAGRVTTAVRRTVVEVFGDWEAVG